MTVHYADESVQLHHGDCLDVLRTLPDNSVDAVVTDPPAGIAFMGKSWDGDKGGREQWSAWLADVMREALRVTKPGGHALVWALPRTAHWTACGLEDAGWEIRDRITHLYGSGFPKSLDVSKAIDKMAGVVRPIVGHADPSDPRTAMARGIYGTALQEGPGDGIPITAPATDAARQWQGWGTALKPGAEDWWVARKPLIGTVAGNVQKYGTGALNIDGCRVGTGDNLGRPASNAGDRGSLMVHDGSHGKESRADSMFRYSPETQTHVAGRWPTNVVLDEHAAEELDAEVGTLTSGKMKPTHTTAGVDGRGTYGADAAGGFTTMEPYGDSGGPSRFFPTFKYAAKAPTRERPSYVKEGAGDSSPLSPKNVRQCNVCGTKAKAGGDRPWPTCGHEDWQWVPQVRSGVGKVAHPTVKPLALMEWLVRLVTPPGGVVLEPFAGSGTTVEACLTQGFRCIAIEREADYLPLIEARINRQRKPDVPNAAEALALFDFEEPA